MIPLLAITLVGVLLVVNGAHAHRSALQLRQSPLHTCADVRNGRVPAVGNTPVTVVGRAVRGPEGVREAPVSLRDCLWWSVAARPTRRGRTVHLPSRARCETVVYLADEEGVVSLAVDTRGVPVQGDLHRFRLVEVQFTAFDDPDNPVAERVRERCPELREVLSGRWHPRIEFTESRVEEGDTVLVTGVPRGVGGAGALTLSRGVPDGAVPAIVVGDPEEAVRRLRGRRNKFLAAGLTMVVFAVGLLALGLPALLRSGFGSY